MANGQVEERVWLKVLLTASSITIPAIAYLISQLSDHSRQLKDHKEDINNLSERVIALERHTYRWPSSFDLENLETNND